MYFSESNNPLTGGGAFGSIEAIGVGVAVLQTGLPFVVSGSFSSQSATVSYIHDRTPPSQQFSSCRTLFTLTAHHPRHFIANQRFVFQLEFDYNGNDIRNARVGALVNQSSTLTASTFSANFEGREQSVRTDPVAEVVFLISGQWDPIGLGYVSFRGKLYVRADGTVRLTDFTSERNWVWVGSPPPGCPRRAPVQDVVQNIRNIVYFSPAGSDRLREGDERRLSQWVLGLAPEIRQAMRAGESTIRVDGFASTTAALAFNRDLSRRRADRVARLLRDLLGPNARIETRAMGEIVARTADRVENERERRVEITVLHTRRVTAASALPVRTPAMAR